MPNRNSAREWLVKAYHDLSSARILYAANHYTDTIGIDLQQSIEKALKSIWAYENKPIKRSHNLLEIYESLSEQLLLNEEQIRLLGLATTYYIQDRYPVFSSELPSREQIKGLMDFAEHLLETVCQRLEIEQNELT